MRPGADEGDGPDEGTGLRTSAERDTADLARGAGVNYLGYIARIAPRALFLVLAGRLFGEARFGVYTFGITVVETAAALALFGMKRSLFKFMSDAVAEGQPVSRPIANGVALAVTVGAVLTVAVGAGSATLARLFGLPGAATPMLIFTLSIPMIVVSDILLVAIRFTRQMRFEVYSRSLAEPITLTLALIVVYWAGFQELGLAIAYVASLFVAAVTSAIFFVRVFPVRECMKVSLRWEEIRRLATFSGPTAGYEFFLMLFDKVDIFLVSYFTPASVVGIYGMARQFSTVTKKMRAGFDRILPPVLSDAVSAGNLKRAEGQLVTVARWILTVEGIIVLFFGFFAAEVLSLLGGGFAGGALILLFLMLGDTIHGSFGISELPFVFLRPFANVLFGAALLGIGTAANIWLIQEMGAEGAALAVLLTVTLVNGARVAAVRWEFGLTMVKPNILKPVAAAIPAIAAVIALEAVLPDVPLLVVGLGVPVLIVSYFGTLRLLGLEPEDRDQVRRVLSRLG